MEKRKKEMPPTLGDIMKIVERDNRCANVALILSGLSLILAVVCAIVKLFRIV